MTITARFGGDVSGKDPSPSIWNRANIADALMHKRGKYLWDDFLSFGGIFDSDISATVGKYFSESGCWTSYQDTSDTVAQIATNDDGVVDLSTAATNNNETWICPGSATSVLALPKTMANGGTSIFFEARVATSTLVGNGALLLSEEGLAAADTQNDTGGTMADKDFLGFVVDEDTPTKVDVRYNKASSGVSGGTLVEAGVHTLVADTFVKLGFIVDMEEGDANKRIKFFVNGVQTGTAVTNSAYENTTLFPTGEELNILFGGKNNNAAKIWRIDWVQFLQLRETF